MILLCIMEELLDILIPLPSKGRLGLFFFFSFLFFSYFFFNDRIQKIKRILVLFVGTRMQF